MANYDPGYRLMKPNFFADLLDLDIDRVNHDDTLAICVNGVLVEFAFNFNKNIPSVRMSSMEFGRTTLTNRSRQHESLQLYSTDKRRIHMRMFVFNP